MDSRVCIKKVRQGVKWYMLNVTLNLSLTLLSLRYLLLKMTMIHDSVLKSPTPPLQEKEQGLCPL
jgi:hypothetical protein